MKENKIVFLSIEEMRIVKQIIIVSQFKSKDISVGYILYERSMSERYKMAEVPEAEKDFAYRFEYPQERLFPVDVADDLIRQAVQAQFPKSRIKNYLIVSTLDKENLDRMTDRQFERGEIVFHPSFANVDIHRMVGKEFSQLSANIKVYNNYKKEEIRDKVFVGYFDVRDKEILNQVKQVNFL